MTRPALVLLAVGAIAGCGTTKPAATKPAETPCRHAVRAGHHYADIHTCQRLSTLPPSSPVPADCGLITRPDGVTRIRCP